MAKTLSERISAREKAKKATRGGTNRAAFLALRDDIQDAMKDGWPVRTVWETLHEEGKIMFGYETFTRYVNRIIRREPTPATNKQTTGNAISSKPADLKSAQPAGIPGFKYDPIPKREDLF